MTIKESSDKVLIKKLNDILETNYFREDFDVTELSEKVGFSHSQLHRKIQAEFRKSTSQYIREFRLKKALKLLQEDVITASEVAYKVGFSSPTYFNKCFNDYFGYPPGQAKYHSSEEAESENESQVNLFSLKNKVRNNQRSLSGWKVPGFLLFFIVLILISFYFTFIREKRNSQIIEGLPSEISVAVLPFKNLSDDKSNQYFADGVMDEMITHLSSIKQLRVISRTTMDRYKESTKSIPEIGDELKVSYIIESTIQKYGDSIRLIIQLIDAKKDKNIWADDVKREFNNIFALESEIAKQIAVKLKTTLSPDEIERIDLIPTYNMEAYNLYLKGNYAFNSNNADSLIEYEKLLSRCLELDPDFAMAYEALARSKIQRMRGLRLPNTKENINEVKALALKSIELNDNARAHASLGWLYLWFEWNWDEAEKHFMRAIQINPNEANGHIYLSEFLYYIKGDFIQARKHLDLGMYLAPYAYYPRSVSADFYFNEGNITKSFEENRKLKEIDVNNPHSYWNDFLNYSTLGEENKAFNELILKWETSPEYSGYLASIKEAFKNSGLNGVYTWLFNNENTILTDKPYKTAQFYALANEKENAIKWLEKSYETHDAKLPYIKYDPLFNKLHTDQRFLSILGKMELGHY